MPRYFGGGTPLPPKMGERGGVGTPMPPGTGPVTNYDPFFGQSGSPAQRRQGYSYMTNEGWRPQRESYYSDEIAGGRRRRRRGDEFSSYVRPYEDLQDFSNVAYETRLGAPNTGDPQDVMAQLGRFAQGIVPYERVRRMQETMNRWRQMGYNPGGRRLRSAAGNEEGTGLRDAAAMAARMRLR